MTTLSTLCGRHGLISSTLMPKRSWTLSRTTAIGTTHPSQSHPPLVSAAPSRKTIMRSSSSAWKKVMKLTVTAVPRVNSQSYGSRNNRQRQQSRILRHYHHHHHHYLCLLPFKLLQRNPSKPPQTQFTTQPSLPSKAIVRNLIKLKHLLISKIKNDAKSYDF